MESNTPVRLLNNKKMLMKTLIPALSLLFSPISHSQSIDWTLNNCDTTILQGNMVELHGTVLTDSLQTYNCNLSVKNINLPNGWSYVFCSPFYCLVGGNNPSTNFVYPDTINQWTSNNGYGTEVAKITIYTSSTGQNEVGELDFVLTNVTQSDTLLKHIIVRTSNGPLSNNEIFKDKIEIFPNPFEDNVYVKSNFNNNEFLYVIKNQAGQLIKTGKTTNSIDLKQISSGIYFVEFTDNSGNVFTKKITKL